MKWNNYIILECDYIYSVTDLEQVTEIESRFSFQEILKYFLALRPQIITHFFCWFFLNNSGVYDEVSFYWWPFTNTEITSSIWTPHFQHNAFSARRQSCSVLKMRHPYTTITNWCVTPWSPNCTSLIIKFHRSIPHFLSPVKVYWLLLVSGTSAITSSTHFVSIVTSYIVEQ